MGHSIDVACMQMAYVVNASLALKNATFLPHLLTVSQNNIET